MWRSIRNRSASSPTTRRTASTIACRRCRSIDTLDVPYLGTVMLDLAGLPLSDSHRERKRLMELCKGRYYTLRAARGDPACSTGA